MAKSKFKNKAKLFCEDHGFRYTDPRRLVIEIIVNAKKPVGAYDILERMSSDGKKPNPPTVYRAIEFWQQHGFIHKIGSLNAFIACDTDHLHTGSQFTICQNCGRVEEIHLCHLPKDIQKEATHRGFQMAHWNTEIHGICNRCQ